MKFDEISTCVSITVICVTIIVCVALGTYNQRTMALITNGYSQKMLVGSSVFAWQKESK